MTTSNPSQAELGRRHEILGIVAAAATALAVLSLGSYDQRGGDNWIGPVGESVAAALVSAFGLLALWLPIELGLTTLALFRSSRRDPPAVATPVRAAQSPGGPLHSQSRPSLLRP